MSGTQIPNHGLGIFGIVLKHCLIYCERGPFRKTYWIAPILGTNMTESGYNFSQLWSKEQNKVNFFFKYYCGCHRVYSPNDLGRIGCLLITHGGPSKNQTFCGPDLESWKHNLTDLCVNLQCLCLQWTMHMWHELKWTNYARCRVTDEVELPELKLHSASGGFQVDAY